MNEFFWRNKFFGIGVVMLFCLMLLPMAVSSSEILYEGPLALDENTQSIPSYISDKSYDVAGNTPLGLLASVSELSLKVSDKIIDTKGILLLDGIGKYEYDKAQGKTWVCEVNGVPLDDYGSPETDGLNKKVITADDTVAFYYGKEPITADNAIASVLFTKSGADEATKSTAKNGDASSDVTSETGTGTIPTNDTWSLTMTGAITDSINKTFFEEAASCHKGSWKDENGNEYTGVPVWRLLGWVDDEISHGSEGFNEDAFTAGYTVTVKAGDGYVKEFSTKDIGTSDDVLVANMMNGKPLAQDGEKPSYPLKLVGPSIKGGNSVGNIVEIALTGLPSSSEKPTKSGASKSSNESSASEIPKIHIVVFGADGKTITNETTVDYQWMEKNLPVIGDGETKYMYEGITTIPEDIWDSNQSFPGGYKIESPVKGTKVRDLVNLVGGMEPGTMVKLVASDGYETKLGYPTIYPNPDAEKKAGDPFVAWYKNGKVVPEFKEGYQLFFTGGDDNVFSNWDMHETMDSNYWHYYWDSGVQYASAAGLSSKYINEIQVFSVPESEWELIVDGTAIGGVKTNISSGYFDSALVCQFGSNHAVTFRDSADNIWKGMALWFLCGFVDDADQHSNKAYNESLADTGYQIVITGADGKSVVVDSAKVKRSSDYIIASTKNDVLIPGDDPSWPLVLTGKSISEPLSKVSKIELKPLE